MKHILFALILSTAFLACQKSETPAPSAPNGQGGQVLLNSGIRPAPQLRTQPARRIIDDRNVLTTPIRQEKPVFVRPSRGTDSIPGLKRLH